jgi:large subunit ribosomal protein L21
MFAVVKTGGKQYKVSNGSIIHVENLNAEEGSEVILDNVLMMSSEDGNISFAHGAKVKALVVINFRGEKLIAFKKRRRHTYKKKVGHRQYLTKLKITSIEGN